MNFIRLLFLAYGVGAMVIGPTPASKAIKYMDNYSAETVDSMWPIRRRSGELHHSRPTPRAHVFRRADEGFTTTGDTRLNTLFVSSNTSINTNTLSSTAERTSSFEIGSGITRSTAGSDAISSSVSISSSAVSVSTTSTLEASESTDSSQPSSSSSVAPSTTSTVAQTGTAASVGSSATSESTSTSTTQNEQITAPPTSPTPTNTEDPVTLEDATLTRTVSGVVFLENQTTTLTRRPTPTGSGSRSNNSNGGGLSAHNKRVVIGCVVGIGLPLLIAIIWLIVYTCMRERRTNFINSEGKVITAYSTSRLSKWWNSLLGRKVIKYESDSPLGGTPLDEDGENIHPDAIDNARNAATRGYHSNRSHELMLHEERYYDVDGNEITPKNY